MKRQCSRYHRRLEGSKSDESSIKSNRCTICRTCVLIDHILHSDIPYPARSSPLLRCTRREKQPTTFPRGTLSLLIDLICFRLTYGIVYGSYNPARMPGPESVRRTFSERRPDVIHRCSVFFLLDIQNAILELLRIARIYSHWNDWCQARLFTPISYLSSRVPRPHERSQTPDNASPDRTMAKCAR